MAHALKTWPEYFKECTSGKKNFEVRKADRPFQVGDTVILHEYDPERKQYTGYKFKFQIGYILLGPAFGIKKDYCVMSMVEISEQY